QQIANCQQVPIELVVAFRCGGKLRKLLIDLGNSGKILGVQVIVTGARCQVITNVQLRI
ncbi:hypothetical protein SOVF_176120, partial [Spinacia oleracea]